MIAALAAGCASRTGAGTDSGSRPAPSSAVGSGGSASAGTATAGTATAVPAAAANKAAAVAEAQRILATYRPPAGATRLAHPPKGILPTPALGSGSAAAYQVDDVAWYAVPHIGAKTLVSSVPRPAGSQPDGSSYGGSNGASGVAYGVAYDWTPINGVLTERTLQVSATTTGGTTIVRVDGIASWQPPRDPKSLVPASATAVTVTYRPNQYASAAPTTEPPVTTTDPAQVAKIVAAVNAAEVSPYEGARPCPYDGGELMTVVFRAGVDGPIVATAAISPSGCAAVRMTVPGGANAVLSDGHALAVTIGKIIGRAWPAN